MFRSSRNWRLLAATALASGVFCAHTAVAQEVQPFASDSAGNPEEIIVTAQKRGERLRDVPISITAATGEQLERMGIATPADLEKITPGFSYSRSQNGTPVFSLRGIGFYSETIAAASTVTVYVDQIPLPYARMTEGGSLDLERVEVLKGPQGTLFGQNSTAGLINYIAAKPTDAFEAGVSATYGRFDQFDISGYVSGPLTDNLRARLAIRTESRDDWQQNNTRDEATGHHDLMIARLLVDFTPTEDLSFELNINGWRDRSDVQIGQARAYLPVAPGPAVTPETLATQTALINYPYVTSDDNRFTDWDPGRSRERDDRFYQVSLRGDYQISDDLKLVSLSSYSHMRLFDPIDGDATFVPALTVNQTGTTEAFNQELRLEGDTDRLKWVVGADYQQTTSRERQNNTITGSNAQVPLPPTFTTGIHHRGNFLMNNQDTDSWAGFASGDYGITDTFRVQAAVRYTQETRDFEGCVGDWPDAPPGLGVLFPGTVPGQCLTLLPDGTLGPFSTSLEEHNTPWRAGFTWKVEPETLLYANVTKGFKSGDFGTVPGLVFTLYEPVTQESVLAYEAGFKTSFGRGLDLSGAVFYNDYNDKQTQGQKNTPPFGNLPFLVNVPKSRIVGGELELVARPFQGLRLTAGATYLNSEVTEEAIVANPFAPVTVDAQGDRLPNTPNFQASLDVEYDFSLSDKVDAYLGATATYRSKAYATLGALSGPPGTQDYFQVDGYGLLDLRAGVEFGNCTVQVWGHNVTDQDYWNNVVHIYDTVDRVTGQPATYGITVSARF